MNFFFELLLAFNATIWMVIIYVINKCCSIIAVSSWILAFMLLIIPVLLSLLTIPLMKHFGKETLPKCQEVSLADGEFLPIYLGYFFVSVSVTEDFTMVVVYIILFIFTFISKTQYFNPAYLLFGFHYYHILTENRTKVFLIKRGKVIRSDDGISFENLRRMNDTTFIEVR